MQTRKSILPIPLPETEVGAESVSLWVWNLLVPLSSTEQPKLPLRGRGRLAFPEKGRGDSRSQASPPLYGSPGLMSDSQSDRLCVYGRVGGGGDGLGLDQI